MAMDKKLKIIQVATKVFASDGYENASVDMIVEKAGVAKGTFYYYFKTKDDLFLSMFKTGVEQLSLFMADEAKKYDSPADRIKAIIESQYAFFSENRDLCRMLISEIWQFESKWKQKYTFIRDQYIDPLKKAIEDGQTRKYFVANIEARTAATAIFGMVATSALDSAVAGEKSFDKAAKIVTEFALRGLSIQ
jgi:AcrR family transcriptional regulator